MRHSYRALVAVGAAVTLVSAGCGDDDASQGGGGDASIPSVVVTTNVLADVVENVAGGQVKVVALMPTGADPHDFRASAQQVAEIGESAAFIVNGGSFEEGLLAVIEGVRDDGGAIHEVLSVVDTIEFGGGGNEDHEESADEAHTEEGHSDEERSNEHAHDGADPHFWQDPARMAVAVDGIADFLVINVDGIDADALESSAAAYIAELEELDAEVEETLAAVESRVLVTNHDAFGYFADRHDFEVAGTVIPSGSSTDGTSAQQLADLAELIEAEGVTAIFTETTVSDDLAQTLAAEVGRDIAVVELYSDSLGEAGSGADTYAGMVRTNAQRVADALTS